MAEIASAPAVPRKDEQKKISWKDSPPTQRLLDVISSIIAEEYIMIAKQNPDVFTEIASPPSGVRMTGARNESSNIRQILF